MADLKARLLKVAKTLMWGIAWSRMLQKPSVSQRKTPVGFSESWFSSVAGTARKNSIRSMGIWLVVSCLPALPRSLLCLTTTIPTEHADRPLCCLPRSRSTRPFFSPGIGTLSEELLPTNSIFCISLSRDLLHRTLIWFSSNVALTKFWNVPPSARIPLPAMTWQSAVFFIII